MLTPNGRFNINTKICITNSSYHKSDWSSTWNIKSILIGFYSIWLDDNEHGISHIKSTKEERHTLALNSIEYNLKNYNSIHEKFNLAHLSKCPPNLKIDSSINEKINEENIIVIKKENIIDVKKENKKEIIIEENIDQKINNYKTNNDIN
jgi:ubiquitin-conjugating enzyme E2 J2